MISKNFYFAIIVLLFSIVPALYLVPKWLINGDLIQDHLGDTIYTILGVIVATYGAFIGSITYLYKKHIKKKKPWEQ
jgi:hypothetical protein